MEKVVRKYTSHKDMKADEYRYWQSRTVEDRMNAVSELTTVAYALKDRPHVSRLQEPLIRLPRPRR